MAARYTKNPEVILTLLNAGANPKIKDHDGYLAIDYAKANPNLNNTDALWKLNDASY
jgi:ankyrin repeat protein